MSEISEGKEISNKRSRNLSRKISRKVKKETFLYSRVVPFLFFLLVLGLLVIMVVVGLSILGVFPNS